jgi:hypothetical protein
MDLMRDLEQRKEKELRAQIEKEEIQRNLKVSLANPYCALGP